MTQNCKSQCDMKVYVTYVSKWLFFRQIPRQKEALRRGNMEALRGGLERIPLTREREREREKRPAPTVGKNRREGSE